MPATPSASSQRSASSVTTRMPCLYFKLTNKAVLDVSADTRTVSNQSLHESWHHDHRFITDAYLGLRLREMGGAPRNPAPRNHLWFGLSNHA